VALKLQKTNKKYRSLSKISIFLQDRLFLKKSGVTKLYELDDDAASRS
jgi:hypothetical protein